MSVLHQKLGIASPRSAVVHAPKPPAPPKPGLIGLLPPPASDQTPPPLPVAPLHTKVTQESKVEETLPVKRQRQEVDLHSLPESKDVLTI